MIILYQQFWIINKVLILVHNFVKKIFNKIVIYNKIEFIKREFCVHEKMSKSIRNFINNEKVFRPWTSRKNCGGKRELKKDIHDLLFHISGK